MDELKRLREAHEAATEGEWEYDGRFVYEADIDVCKCEHLDDADDNARAIALYHNTYGALLDFAEAVEAELAPTARGVSPQWIAINTERHFARLRSALAESEGSNAV